MEDKSNTSPAFTPLAAQLREIAPYIQLLKGQLAVVLIPGELSQLDSYQTVINDLILLHSIGVKLAIVFGSRPQINNTLQGKSKGENRYLNNTRVTGKDEIQTIVELCAKERLRHQKAFRVQSSGHATSNVSVAWGNWVSAKPLGIIDGTDMQNSGVVRRIHTKAINNLLDNGHITLFDVIALSPIGTAYNLVAEDLALELAMQLQADKMLVYSDFSQLNIELPVRLTMSKAQQFISKSKDEGVRALQTAITARKGGVKRIYLLNMHLPGAILQELLTINGGGIMLSDDDYESIGPAREQDIGAILALIEPLIQSGLILKRDRKQLETSLQTFRVMRRDQMIIGCCSLVPLEHNIIELGCFAIKPEFRRAKLGKGLLADSISRCPEKLLVTFTTQAIDWFIENGFQQLTLPAEKLPAGLRARLEANSKQNRHATCLIHGDISRL